MSDAENFDDVLGTKPRPTVVPDFKCRVCGYHYYRPIYQAIEPIVCGRNKWRLIDYECCDCKTRFSNPRSFSLVKKAYSNPFLVEVGGRPVNDSVARDFLQRQAYLLQKSLMPRRKR